MNRMRRRSGNAVAEYCGLINWTPQQIVIAGLGVDAEEPAVFKHHWPDVHIRAYEANRSICEKLPKNYPADVTNIALSSFCGKRQFYYKSQWKNGGSLLPKADEAAHQQEAVATTTLDADWCLRRGDAVRTLLWLDIEGSELDAINGGETFIRNQVDVINIEVTGNPREANWPTPEEIWYKLWGLDFRFVWAHSTRSCIGQFDAIYVRRSLVNHKFSMNPII